MNMILNKERRALRPALIATVAATVACALFLNGSDASAIVMTAFGIGVVLMAASAFGNEFHTRTMLLLLSQPVSRRRLWFDKMRELALELTVSYVVLLLLLAFVVHGEGRLEHLPLTAAVLIFIPLIAFCSTPFASLSIKNTLGAMGFTVTVPWILVMLAMGTDWLVSIVLLGQPKLFLEVADERHPALLTSAAVIAALVYSATLYRAGYHTFMNYQIIDSQTQELSLPQFAERALGRWMEKLVPGYSGPVASLVRKELRLQRVSYILAGFALLIAPFLWAVWKIHPSELTITLAIVPIIICIFALPFLSGLAVAEERNLGVLSSQLTLPVSLRKQWTVKISVAFFTCVLLGVIFPAVLMSIGNPEFRTGVFDAFNRMDERLLFPALVYVSLFAMVVYASTFSPNVTRGMIAACGVLTAFGSACGLGAYVAAISLPEPDVMSERLRIWTLTHHFDPVIFKIYVGWAGVAVIGLLVLLLLFLLNRFSFVNFRSGQLPKRRLWTQLSIIVLLAGILGFVGQALMFMANGVFLSGQ